MFKQSRLATRIREAKKVILTVSSIAIGIFSTGITVAVPLDELSLNIINSPNNIPVIWREKNEYGFGEQLSQSQLNNLNYCSSDAGCHLAATSQGAVYYDEREIPGHGLVVAYYDAWGNLTGTKKGGLNTADNTDGGTDGGEVPIPSAEDPSTADPVGYLEGDFSVSNSGAATYNVPIALPPGSGGVAPEISLTYSSQAGEGLLGQGWSISGLSSIARCGKTIAQDGFVSEVKLDTTDRYCLDGQRLISIEGNYGENGTVYKTEIDDYSKIVSYDTNGDHQPEYFKIWTKSGEIITYGQTDTESADAYVEPVGPDEKMTVSQRNQAMSWAIQRLEDRKTNYVEFKYVENRTDSGLEHYPDEIRYTGNVDAGQTPFASIKFKYESRPVSKSGYFLGSKVLSSKRLKNVEIHLESKLIRNYKLSYYSAQTLALDSHSRLYSIQECSGGGACLPATWFAWDGGHFSNKAFVGGEASSFPSANNNYQAKTTNVSAKGIYIPPESTFASKDAGTPEFKTSSEFTQFGWGSTLFSTPLRSNTTEKLIGDINGDGLSDIVVVVHSSTSIDIGYEDDGLYGNLNKGEINVRVALSTGTQFTTQGFDASKAKTAHSLKGQFSPTKTPHFLADVNGDGLSDLVGIQANSVMVSLSTGSAFLEPVNWLPGSNMFTQQNGWHDQKHPRFVQDINGDGKADILGIGRQGVYAALSNGTRFEPHTEWSIHFGRDAGTSTGARFGGIDYSHAGVSAELVDISGDSLPDIVVHNLSGTRVAINNPVTKKFELLSDKYDLKSIDSGTADTPRRMGDVNGDGYVDVIGFFLNAVYVAYGTGKGFDPYVKKYKGMVKNEGGWEAQDPRYVLDVNGDGLSDLLGFGNMGVQVYLSSGDNFFAVNGKSEWAKMFGRYYGWKSPYNVRTFGDFNGDGLIDIVGIDKEGVNIGENRSEPQRIQHIIQGGFLPPSEIAQHDGLNRSIEIVYEKLTANGNISVYDPSYSGKKGIRPGMFVVSEHYSSNGDISNQRTQQAGMKYLYTGLQLDKKGRGLQGFASRMATDLTSGISTISHYRHDFPYTGRTRHTETRAANGQIISSTQNFYNSKQETASGGRYYRVYDTHSISSSYAYNTGNTLYKIVKNNYSTPDACGNINGITTRTTDLVTEKTYKKFTSNEYKSNAADCFIAGRLERASVTSNDNGATKRTSSFEYYDDGQLKHEIIQPGHELALTTTYKYDVYGNVIEKQISGKGFATRTITSDYIKHTGKGRYATYSKNALNQEENKIYDPRFGVVVSHTGPNNRTTRWKYNDFGQKYQEKAPNGNLTHIKYEWCNENIHGNQARYCTTTRSSGGGYSKTYYDQVDRVLRQETHGLGDGGSKTVYSDKQYNLGNGQLVQESLPYYKGTSPSWVEYTYDALERPKTIKQPGQAAAEIIYDGLSVTRVDAKENRVTETQTVEGKLAMVEDHLGNKTEYKYYDDGNLHETHVTAADGNGQDNADSKVSITSFKYDKLGNKVEMTDPDMGTWSYGYNAAGELVSQTNAKGQTTTTEYDALGRIKLRTEGTNRHEWHYDPENAIGQIDAISGSNGYKKTQSYTALGQISEITETLPNSTQGGGTSQYTRKYSYDSYGRLDTLSYPVSQGAPQVKVKHHYEQGILTKITDGVGSQAYWEAKQANASGKLTQELLGNRVYTHTRHDILGRVSSIQSGLNQSASLQNLSYRFDAVGNLTLREDKRQGLQEVFGYDGLNRLTSTDTRYKVSGTTHNQKKTIRYDGHGNITKKDGVLYTYDTGNDTGDNSDCYRGGSHAVSKIGNNKYCYDSNGNLTEGGGRTLQWTAFDKPFQIKKGTTTVQLGYSAGRERVIKESGGTTTWYVGNLYEREKKQDGSETHKYYLQAGGKKIAMLVQHKSPVSQWSEDIRYLHQDHLGSTDVITDANGNIISKLSFGAWGARRGSSWNPILDDSALATVLAGIQASAVKLGFTGHEHDDEVGLVNMKGRLYDAKTGRFISADPHVQAPNDTQSFNRYSYVKNNPLSYTDPSGYFFKKLFRSIGKFFKKYGRTILAIAATIYTAGAASAWLGANTALSGFGVAVSAGAAGGFAGGLVSTGSLKGALTGAVFGALSAGLASGVKATFAEGLGRTIAHGVAQGTVSVLRGGKFKGGFAGGFFGHMSRGFVKGIGKARSWGKYGRTAVAATIGGTISKAVGGKFANGAVTAAFTHLFNAEMRDIARQYITSRGDKLKNYLKTMYAKSFAELMKSSTWKGQERYIYFEDANEVLDLKHAFTSSKIPAFANGLGFAWEVTQDVKGWDKSAYIREDIFSNYIGSQMRGLENPTYNLYLGIESNGATFGEFLNSPYIQKKFWE